MLRPYSFQLNSHSSAFHSLNRSLPISFVTRFSIRAIFQLPFVNIPFHFPNASHLQSNSRHYSENELQTLTHPPTHTYLTTDTFNKAAYLHWLSTMAYWNRSGFKKTWDNYKMCIKSPPPPIHPPFENYYQALKSALSPSTTTTTIVTAIGICCRYCIRFESTYVCLDYAIACVCRCSDIMFKSNNTHTRASLTRWPGVTGVRCANVYVINVGMEPNSHAPFDSLHNYWWLKIRLRR